MSDTGDPAAVVQRLRSSGPAWWRQWQPGPIDEACAEVPLARWAQHPVVPFWRAMASLMSERDDTHECLALAYEGHLAQRDSVAAAVTCHAALALALLDTGAMDRSDDWLARAQALPPLAPDAAPAQGLEAFWWRLGWLARVALGQPATREAAAAALWLHDQLRPLRASLAPDERLMAAQVLVDYHFACERYAQFDALASTVAAPPWFEQASPLSRARWCCTLGYAHFQVGAAERAQRLWQQGREIATAASLVHAAMLCSLALARLWLDRGRLDDAAPLLEQTQPQWGSGRVAQLVEWQQMRARLLLLRGQARQAAAAIEDALQLAADAGLPAAGLASCRTDQVQVLIAQQRFDDAAALLAALVAQHPGRDRQIYACLQSLWQGWCLRTDDPAAARTALADGLVQAQSLRYTMFFRLLPALAAQLCECALRWDVEAAFVREVIALRGLAAPADAGGHWPWPCWLRLIGGFEWQLAGQVQQPAGKTQHKPLELLRLMACERQLALGTAAAAAMLWPQAEDAAARKNLETTVQRLRKLLGDDSLVRVADGRVGLDATRVSSDVQQRRRCVEALEALAVRHAAPSGHDAAECLALLARVQAFGGGELLPGAPDAAWLTAERRRCAQDPVRAALAAATVLEGQGAGPAEQALLRHALAVEPLAEGLVLRLMQAHARAGQRAQGLQVYEQFLAALAASGLAPSAALQAQWRALVGGGAAAQAPSAR